MGEFDSRKVGAFDTSGGVTSNTPGTLASDDFVFGSDQLDDDGDTDHDARVIFDKSKRFFGAGSAQSTQWDEASRGYDATLFGKNCSANGAYGVAWGYASVAASSYSHASGLGSRALGMHSRATGAYAATSDYGETAHASGRFTADGDAQRVEAVWRAQTTDGNATELFLDGTDDQFTIPNGGALTATIELIGTRTDTPGTTYGRVDHVTIENIGGTTALVGGVTTAHTADGSGGSYAFAIDADDGNDAIRLKATGAAGETVQWVATMTGAITFKTP